jgi:hypothetical protein
MQFRHLYFSEYLYTTKNRVPSDEFGPKGMHTPILHPYALIPFQETA